MHVIANSRMDYQSLECEAVPAQVNISRFQGQSGVEEYHIVVHPTRYAGIETQLEWVERAYHEALENLGLSSQSALLRRFLCSDLSNQAQALEARPFSNPRSEHEPCAVSWVRQPPMAPAKVALWAYHANDPGKGLLDKSSEGSSLVLRRGELTHFWTTGLTNPNPATSSHDQTRIILARYEAFLRSHGLSLADNVVRTWFFVQNVDANYQGLVVGRREFFCQHGLTPETHFIASTGIEGAHHDLSAKVTLDSYAIAGVRAEQIEFLAAPEHLSPTHIYGVTFERATSVAYRDRKHVFLSGTASIDHQGRIVHPGDVSRQLERTLGNIEALLGQAGATLKDMAVFLVYVRDPSDHSLVWQKMRERFGELPVEIVVAPVCRPGWLVEIEGIAVLPHSAPHLPAF